MISRFVCLFCFAALLSCASSNDKEQPNKLTDITPRVKVRVRWEASAGSGSSDLYRVIAPVISKDTVYANDYRGRVFAFDRENGKLKWSQRLKMEVAAGIGLDKQRVFLGSLNGDVIALDIKTGKLQWRVNVTSEILSPPQSNGQVIVVQTNDGKLLGLDASDGKQLWAYSTQLPILTLRGTATPQVLGPNIVTGFANGKLAALSAVDGTPFWERRIARPQGRSDIERVVDIDGSPVLSGKTIFATSYNGTLSALNPRGEILWSSENSSYSSPTVIGNRVIVTTAEGYTRAFAADTGLLLWENQLLKGRRLSAPQDLAGFAVAADYKGYVHVFDTETGAILDRFQIEGSGVRAPMVSDGTYLYVLSNDGKLASIAVYLFQNS